MSEPAVGPVRPEYVTPGWAEQLARSIAPIRDVSGDEEDAGLPASCRLLDMLGLDPPDAGAIAARWQAGGRVHARGDRGVLRRAVRHRPGQGRAARAGRRDHRGRQVRAAADHDRVAGLREPARMR